MGGLINKKYQKYYFIALVAIIFVLLPERVVHAGLLDWSLEYIFAKIMLIIFTVVGKFISVLAYGLNGVINIPVYPEGGIAVVDASWKIMRNFANMFFVVILIVMAFATIFNITKYEARSLFPKFLIAAILINFSLVLGGLIIDGSQILSNAFLVSIGDMSNRLGDSLNPSKLLPKDSADIEKFAKSTQGVEQTVLGSGIQLVFAVVMAFTFLFSMLTAFLFAFIRIPILWALLVVSPIAWILSILPAMQGTYRKWWSLFIGWNLFLPIFLFFLYFSLYFLQNQGDVMAKIAAQTKDQNIVGFTTFQTLFFYVLASVFLIGGTITAMKASIFSGTGVVGVAQWSRGVVSRRLGLTAAGAAAQQKIGQIKEEGLPGRVGSSLYGGKYGLEQQTGGFAQRFGVRGAEIKNQKAFVDRAGKDYQDFERQYQNGQITEAEIVNRAKQFDATDPRGFAYRKLAAKIGQLDNPLFTSTLTQLSKNPLAAEDFAKTAGASKFSKMKGSDLAKMAAAERGTDPTTGIPYDYTSLKGSVAARREMYRYVQTDGKAAGGLNKTQFDVGLELFGGHTTAEGKTYLENMAKVRPDYMVDHTLNTPDLINEVNKKRAEDNKPPVTRSDLFDSHLKDPKDIANIPLSVWKAEDGDFRQALERKLSFGSVKAQRNFRNRILDNLRTASGGEEKKNILNALRGARDTGQGGGGDNFGEDDLGIDNEEGEENKRPSGRTNSNNVVDLRPGERRSSGGIILTPRAQFEKEREERKNP